MTTGTDAEDPARLTPIAMREGDIVRIALNRPEKANALSSALLTAVLEAMDAAEAALGVRAVILSGEGRHFCAGADLAELLEGGAPGIRRLLDLFRAVCLRFESSPLAVVAMVQGAARAGGLELILACDAAVAEEGATIGDAHVLRDLLPGGGSSVRLPPVIGRQRARWMILSGAAIGAAQARDWGLVTETAPAAGLEDAARALALSLSCADRATMARVKALVGGAGDPGFSAALESEIAALERHSAAPAMQEGLRRFVSG